MPGSIQILKIIFTKYLFLVFVIFFALSLKFGETNTYGVSKSVGCAYNIHDIRLLNVIVYPLSEFLFMFGYLIVMIFQRKTNFYLSVSHFALVVLSFIITSQEYYTIGFICCLVSVILFFINLVKSYK